MALTSSIQWEAFLTTTASIPATEAATYTQVFVQNRVAIADVVDFEKADFNDLGITIIGDIKRILRHAKSQSATPGTTSTTNATPDSTTGTALPVSFMKSPAAKLPQLNADMTHPQFRKFKMDWDVFKRITNLPDNQLHAQLYNSCDDHVQNSLVNMVSDFFTLSEENLLKTLEDLVTKKSNPTVHRLQFASILQQDNESIKDYVIRLKSSAPDCAFSCPNCQSDLQPIHIKDQFIRGICNDTLQTDILAKASHLQTLEAIVNHAEAFEAAQRDQSQLQRSSEVMAARTSEYQRNKRYDRNAKHVDHTNSTSSKSSRGCSGCGSHEHGLRGSNDRSSRCPAWGKVCGNCQVKNHFSKVCRRDNVEKVECAEEMDVAEVTYSLVAKVTDGPHMSMPSCTPTGEILAEVSPSLPRHQHVKPISMYIFPDSGASICLAGPQHIAKFNLDLHDIIPCTKQVKAVGGSKLTCIGWLPMSFKIGCNTTSQPVYICDKIDRMYFSKNGCIDVNILSPSFPAPMESIQQEHPDYISAISKPNAARQPKALPQRPSSLPYPATEENVPKLKIYLLDKFKETTFNDKAIPFPAMSAPPAHIHLKPDAQPYARHSPIPVPLNWRDEIKSKLDEDVGRGIITPVPIGTPVVWCAPMVITAKKNGKPRRTQDFQRLNGQCLRETHHCQPPFLLACQIPPHTKKTVLDAVDGYFAVELDKESQLLTTFITEWGRYMNLRLPPGFIAAGDAYTRRYDEIIKDVVRKIKVVDDTLLYDRDIEQAFFHVWDYLVLCATNGIVISIDKFQFCCDTVEFAGLRITPTGISPSPAILAAIADFPTPKDLTGARSWFGLVNQIAWAYSISPLMQPFRELIKANTKFLWNDELDKIFHASKVKLISQVEEGIRTFDTKRRTGLQTDWSKEGIGYLLLQQHCHCSPANAPICCPDGWRLVFAGSRFTTPAESRYSPTEGEALAVVWGLDNARMFVLGCKELLVITDHKPLLGIFKDRELSSIPNPRLSCLKEKTFRYQFSIQHCPGKWHRGPDAMSRNPSNFQVSFVSLLRRTPSTTDIEMAELLEHRIIAAANDAIDTLHEATVCQIDNDALITIEQIQCASQSDDAYKSLIHTIQTGFPENRTDTIPALREYWEVRRRLSSVDGVVFLDRRIVIPSSLRNIVLNILHSAHQGSSGMKARAATVVYWPGMNASIHTKRFSCRECNGIAPSQPKEPIQLSPPPEWPFQQICADYFELSGHSYLSIVDRFSGWLNIYHIPTNHATSKALISICRALFISYGAPEEFSADGGPQFQSKLFSGFLETWGAHYRKSSVAYPQSNGRAELGVKAAKRIIMDNASSDGSLDNDKVARAVMQYRNTPLPHINLSPSQILFHRQLRDHLPAHPQHYKLHEEWLLSAKRREEALAERNNILATRYNETAHNLLPLEPGTRVSIHDDKKARRRWNKTGTIVESLPNRQYHVKVDGSGRITLRNRRFLRPTSIVTVFPVVSPSPLAIPTDEPSADAGNSIPSPHHSDAMDTSPTPALISPPVPCQDPPSARIPRALKCLSTYNTPGLHDQPMHSGGRRDTSI